MLRIGLFVAVAFVITFGSAEVRACSCQDRTESEKFNVEKAKSEASVIFVGRVIDIIEGTQKQHPIYGVMKEFVFEVSRVWKGNSLNRVTVITGSDDGVCGYAFVKGEEFLVYGTNDRTFAGSISTNSCFRTQPAKGETFRTDVKYLGKSRKIDSKKGN
jgi:hypothetical protein